MSHEEPTDLRIQRTHHFLQEAMIELMTEKGFDAITVGDIAERAMINRATFYRHYQDKYDLVAKIFEETADYLVEHMKPFHKDSGQKDTEHPPEIQQAHQKWWQNYNNEHIGTSSLVSPSSIWKICRIRQSFSIIILPPCAKACL